MPRLTTVRLPDDLAARLDHLAAALDRPRAWVIEQAIARYVAEEAWQVAAIAEALTAYRKGDARLTPHAEVMQELEEQITARTGDARPLA